MNPQTRYADGYPVKLVRDFIGPRLGGKGTISYQPIGDHRNHVELLRKKMIEEAVEYLLDPSLGELADVYEAVTALAELDLGVTLADVREAAAQKAQERGGFRKGIVMVAHHPADGHELLPAEIEGTPDQKDERG